MQACLRAFTADEELEGEEAHRCEKCRYQSRSTKALRISRCPPVLVLHLKRFSLADPADYLSPLEKVGPGFRVQGICFRVQFLGLRIEGGSPPDA